MQEDKLLVSGGKYSDKEAESYIEAKHLPIRGRIEMFTTLGLIGDLSDKRVIDVACGHGWLTKELKRQLHAKEVIGTDMSPKMIEIARKENVDGIHYKVEDARFPEVPHPGEEFDVVVSAWLLVNARNRLELSKMCKGLAIKAKSGSKLVTLVLHPDLFDYHEDLAFFKKYGFEFKLPLVLKEGASIVITLYNPDGELSMQIENYYFPEHVYIEELEKAGFEDVKTITSLRLQPSESGRDDYNEFKEFLESPIYMYFVATKK